MVVQILFVQCHDRQQAVQVEFPYVELRRQSDLFRQCFDGSCRSRFGEAFFLGKTCDGDHADRDRFSVRVFRIMGVRFQSMGNCVAKVQQHPFAGILFILLHDSALDVAARVEDFFDVRHQLFTGMQCLQETEEFSVLDAAVLDDFA